MHTRHALRPKVVSLLAAAVLLAGCGAAGQFRKADRLFKDGDYVEAVAQYEAAALASPDNVRYRQQYMFKKRQALETLFRDAERARQQGDLSRAEGAYQTALQIESGNNAAQEWLRRLAAMRRHNEELIRIDEMIAAGELDEAEERVRDVLAEAPDNLRAQNSLDRIRGAVAKKKASEDTLSEQFRKPVTLEFRDVPVKTAFEVLSNASGINFVYDQDIRPDLKVTVFLRKTPLDEAIRMIGLSTNLETRPLNNNSVMVFPRTPQKISDYRQLNIRTFYLANAQAKTVADTLKTILKSENLVVDEKLNMLVMRDSPDAIRLAERLVALQDIGEPEVVLDVEVLEMKRSSLLDMGISLPDEIGFSVVGPGQTNTALPISQLRNLNSDSIFATVPNATVKLHDERSDAKILANPKIRVKSREKASILIGDKVPVITSTSTSTGFVSETVNYVDVGLKLEVEPAVYAGDEVSIKVGLEVSNLVREIVTKSGTLSYQIGTRNAQTVLRLKDGEMQILAGLINREDRTVANGWPGISRFPILNRIFGTQKNDSQNTEIVLSIRPRLVRGVRHAGLDEMEFESGTATNLRGRNVAAPTSAGEGQPAGAPGDTATGAAPAGIAPSAIKPVQPDAAVPTALPSAPPAQAAPLPPSSNVLLDWSVPGEVRAGEQFSAVLNISALKAIEQIPVLVGFDPKVLQVVGIEEGMFMSQGGGQSTLTQQVNLSDGKIIATATRQGTAVSGQGTLLQINFKALAPTDRTDVRVLSATPSPEQVGPARTAAIAIKVR
ncbi:cohesin domain-containing protein [Lysobacter soli]|uniref:secretin N-terminal domain-containing protein n=1 Tax=Lysobacter TaxID=68 RepID=UPI0017892138|nr:secretin N-terminal domain-containing protein [Lysobacter soli]UTA52657.1 cohesin domain-containing protein [Lysobacter soli]